MLVNDKIDKKIHALTTLEGVVLDEEEGEDLFTYIEMRDFAEENGGILYFIGNKYYLVLDIIGEKDYLIIPAECSL